MVGFPGKYIGLASILENAGSTVSRDEREQCVFNTLALLRQTRMHPVGCVPSAGGRGWCLPRGVSAQGECIPACTEADTPDPVDRILDTRF